MIHPSPLRIAGPALEAYDWFSYGTLDLPLQQVRFGFQLDYVPPSFGSPQIVFGLVQWNPENHSITSGFAVRFDMESGEIWDLLNDTGLVGWVENPLGPHAFSEEDPMLLSWEVERLGAALIPKLQIGGEEWLYPSVRCPSASKLTAIAGCASGDLTTEELFLHPAVWREDLGY
jgi:hypothetical protein